MNWHMYIYIYLWGWSVWSGTPTRISTYRIYNTSECYDFFINYSTHLVLTIHYYFDCLPCLKSMKVSVLLIFFSKMNFYQVYSLLDLTSCRK